MTDNRTSILIIEDDEDIRELLALAMGKEGWRLLMAASGEEALAILGREQGARAPACIVLDIMLPGMDGLRTIRRLKADERTRRIPVIMATARSEEADIVAGLELGADDYVVKPYSPKVLTARVRAALRRMDEAAEAAGSAGAGGGAGTGAGADGGAEQTFWSSARITLDAARHEARLDGAPLRLTATEFALLRHFLAHPCRVFTRDQLIDAVHGTDYPATDRSVDVQVSALRRKLQSAGALIETIRGIGYRFSA